MKQRFIDKLLISLCGLILFAISMLVFLWSFSFVPAAWASAIPKVDLSLPMHVCVGAVSFLLMVLGMYCFLFLFRGNSNKKGFVLQKTDNGQLSISIRAMENLVSKCIDQHEEIKIVSSSIANTRDGVVVNLRIGLANGVSIPLAVNALQKQIKQYIQACSGIEVKEVRVQVDTANAKAAESPYMVHDSFLKAQEPEPVIMKEPTKPVVAVKEEPAQAPAESPAKVPPVYEEEEEEQGERKPLHQRLFGKEHRPAAVQMPPIPTEEELLQDEQEPEKQKAQQEPEVESLQEEQHEEH